MDMTVKDISGGTRWVCPNDRHLSLRAKLQTGWSVKTGSLDSKWSTYSNSYSSGTNRCAQSFVLTDEEQQTIIQVIQRAEALNLSEQERIGRLVERLENMKRNVCIVTATRLNEKKRCGSKCFNSTHCVCSCALCGEKFGTVLGASSNLCKDCRRYICQKCGIETNELSSSLSNISTTRERTEERTGMQRIVRRSNSGQRQFLCRICAETREMWKKSGAWFLRGMPKYILPEKKERGWSRSIHKTSTWTIGANKSLESTEPQDSSSDEEATRRLTLARGHSNSFSSLQRNQDGITNKAHSSSLNSAQSTSSTSKSRGQRLSPLNSREECLDQLDRSTLSITSQCSRLSPSPTSPRSRISPRANSNDSQIEQHVSFEDEIIDEKNKKLDDINEAARKLEISSCDQSPRSPRSPRSPNRLNFATVPMISTTTTTVMSTEQILEQSQIYEKRTDQEGNRSSSEQGSLCSNNQIDLVRQQIPESEMKQNYGTLEISLRYDPTAQCLHCKVERARGLQSMDIHGLADPFCKLNILPVDTVSPTKRLRTKTVHKTQDPEFNETLNFYGTTETDILNGKALHVLILQDDPAGQDFLGEAKFPLHELQPRQMKHYNVPLQDHYPVDNEEAAWGVFSSGRGQIQVSLSYCTRRRALTVTIHRARNLLPMDNNGFSDPFVKLCLIENMANNHRQRVFVTAKKLVSKKATGRNVQSTTIKWKTLNPEWNEEFAFATRLTDLMKLTLCLTVWDKDFGKSNDYLGGLELSCNSKGARLRHWIDVIKFPDHRHQAWHNLIDTILPFSNY